MVKKRKCSINNAKNTHQSDKIDKDVTKVKGKPTRSSTRKKSQKRRDSSHDDFLLRNSIDGGQ